MTRRYCGRVGAAFVAADDARCPECSLLFSDHFALPDGICGTWTRCPGDCGAEDGTTPPEHGHFCGLQPGHDGPHRSVTGES